MRRKCEESTEKVRSKYRKDSEKEWEYDLNETQKRIISLLLADGHLSAAKIAEQLELGSRSIEKNIKKLKDYDILVRHGSPKGGYWEVLVECKRQR